LKAKFIQQDIVAIALNFIQLEGKLKLKRGIASWIKSWTKSFRTEKNMIIINNNNNKIIK
jgi:hypothetical protein